MKMIALNQQQRAEVYENLMVPNFPKVELKPLKVIEDLVEKGTYLPYGFEENGGIIGLCCLWTGGEEVGLVDYLCVDKTLRNGGLGGKMIAMLQDHYPTWVIAAESEYPAFAPNPELAERRLGFYQRNQGKTATFNSSIFGVVYTIFYWGKELTQAQYTRIYAQSFSQEKMAKNVRIPFDVRLALAEGQGVE